MLSTILNSFMESEQSLMWKLSYFCQQQHRIYKPQLWNISFTLFERQGNVDLISLQCGALTFRARITLALAKDKFTIEHACCWFLLACHHLSLLIGCIKSQHHAKRIRGEVLQRQFNVLPHWDRSCRSNLPSHPVTVYWHWVNQSQRWLHYTRHLVDWSPENQFLSHWYE